MSLLLLFISGGEPGPEPEPGEVESWFTTLALTWFADATSTWYSEQSTTWYT